MMYSEENSAHEDFPKMTGMACCSCSPHMNCIRTAMFLADPRTNNNKKVDCNRGADSQRNDRIVSSTFTSICEIQVFRVNVEKIPVGVERGVDFFRGKFHEFLCWSYFIVCARKDDNAVLNLIKTSYSV